MPRRFRKRKSPDVRLLYRQSCDNQDSILVIDLRAGAIMMTVAAVIAAVMHQ